MNTTQSELTNTTQSNALANSKVYPWIVISFCALFLFYKYVLQVSPSVITHELMVRYHLDGAGLGNLAATFFYTYLIVQLFAGPLLDRLGTRLLTAVAIALCAIGCMWFSDAAALWQAAIARCLIGAGAAFATVSYIKIAAVWFDQKQFAMVSGLLATAAMIGSMCGQLPFALLVVHIGWQNSLFYCGLFGLLYAVGFYCVVRDDKNGQQKQVVVNEAAIQLCDVIKVICFRPNWYLMLYSGLAFSTLAVFSGLWGDAFLQTVFHISKPDAASLTSVSFLGLAIGAPVLGYLSDRYNARYSVMLYSLLVSIVSLFFVLYFPPVSRVLEGVFLFIFGFSIGAFMLVFAVGKELNALTMTATVVAFINTGEAIIGTFSEPFLGKLLDIFGKGKMQDGVPYFNAHDYHVALILLPVYLIFALVFLMCLKKQVN